ncbi:MAG: hypothetical protein AAFU53_18665, partial [Cyanobacteria bacterium J06632_3]
SYVDGRNTQDIDFIMSRQSLETLSELNIIEENNDFARASFNNLQVDIRLDRNSLFNTVHKQHSRQQNFGTLTIQTSTVEGLVLLKLYALPSLYRQGKFDKVSIYETDILLLLLLRYTVDLGKLLDTLKAHVLASDLDEIKQIVSDIQKRLNRFQP